MFKNKFSFLVLLLIILIILSISYNKFVLPVVIEVTQKYAVTTVNSEINKAYSDIIEKKGLEQSDFTIEQGNGEYINTNTVIVNSICGEMAEVISRRLNNIDDRSIKIPLGVFTSNNILSNVGPNINICIDSMGEARVDYDSSFVSCGVNQVNYKLWLNVETEVAVITPVVHKNIVVKRKILVIDMVYNGGVPGTYLNVGR